jgi:DNA-binding MarR family transcriptional regulator
MQASGSPTATHQLAERFGAFLARMHRESADEWLATVDELELSLSQLKALHALSAGELSISTLAGRLGLSLPAASRAADGLVTRGLIERRACDEDRRARFVRLTTAGEEAVRRVHAARLAGLETFLTTLDDEQRTAIAALLETIG